MGKIKQGVFNTGPILHLSEIARLEVLEIVEIKFLPSEVAQELQKYAVPLDNVKNLTIKNLTLNSKNWAKYLCEQYSLDLAEASAIALAKQEKVKLFCCDDLDARDTAITLGFSVHGTLGLVLRSFRENKMSREEVFDIINDLATKSSLFLTSDLLAWIRKEVEQYSEGPQ